MHPRKRASERRDAKANRASGPCRRIAASELADPSLKLKALLAAVIDDQADAPRAMTARASINASMRSSL